MTTFNKFFSIILSYYKQISTSFYYFNMETYRNNNEETEEFQRYFSLPKKRISKISYFIKLCNI